MSFQSHLFRYGERAARGVHELVETVSASLALGAPVGPSLRVRPKVERTMVWLQLQMFERYTNNQMFP